MTKRDQNIESENIKAAAVCGERCSSSESLARGFIVGETPQEEDELPKEDEKNLKRA